MARLAWRDAPCIEEDCGEGPIEVGRLLGHTAVLVARGALVLPRRHRRVRLARGRGVSVVGVLNLLRAEGVDVGDGHCGARQQRLPLLRVFRVGRVIPLRPSLVALVAVPVPAAAAEGLEQHVRAAAQLDHPQLAHGRLAHRRGRAFAPLVARLVTLVVARALRDGRLAGRGRGGRLASQRRRRPHRRLRLPRGPRAPA